MPKYTDKRPIFSNDYTLADVKRTYRYDPITGIFIFISGKKKGQLAGKMTARGYVRITVNGKSRYAHRVAWLYMTGDFPSLLIDHVNGHKWDNRFCNLRNSSYCENGYNRKRGVNNTSGRVGVHWVKRVGMYRVDIKRNKERIVIGNFRSYDEACAARDAAEIQHFGDFRRGSK